MLNVTVGTRGEKTVVVDDAIAVKFLGLEGARVLGTPYMILLMEIVSRDAIKPLLGDAYDSVGTEVCIRHLAATPIGMRVRFTAEVTGVQDRRVSFKVEAHNELEKIGEGTHERAIIHVQRFAEKVQGKFEGGGQNTG